MDLFRGSLTYHQDSFALEVYFVTLYCILKLMVFCRVSFWKEVLTMYLAIGYLTMAIYLWQRKGKNGASSEVELALLES